MKKIIQDIRNSLELPKAEFISLREDLPEEEYHARPELSKSSLQKFVKSPLLYWHEYLNPDRVKSQPTDAQIIGSAAHLAILEPDRFDDEVVCAPKVDRRTKAGKQEWGEFVEESGNAVVLKKNDYFDICRMRDACWKHPVGKEMLKSITKTEVSVFYKLSGIPMRSRIDSILGTGSILDLKTTRGADVHGFGKSVRKYAYHAQAAIYTLAYESAYGKLPKEFWFLAVEKNAPFSVGIYNLDESYIFAGLKWAFESLERFKVCRIEDKWPDYNDNGTATLIAPGWIDQ